MTAYLPLTLFCLSMVSLIASPQVIWRDRAAIKRSGCFAIGSIIFLALALRVAI